MTPEGIVRSCEFGRKYLHCYGSFGENGILRTYMSVMGKIYYFV